METKRHAFPSVNREETFSESQDALLAFRDARDWRQFHTPRQLAAALAIEAGELQQAMLWMAVSVAATVALAIVTGGKALVLFLFLPLFWPWRKR